MARRGCKGVVRTSEQPFPATALPGGSLWGYPPHVDTVTLTLPPDLESFAAEAVAAGRYRDVAEVVRTGVRLLRQAEAEVANFVASLEEAQAEGERDGFLTAEQVEHRVRAAIADVVTRRG